MSSSNKLARTERHSDRNCFIILKPWEAALSDEQTTRMAKKFKEIVSNDPEDPSPKDWVYSHAG